MRDQPRYTYRVWAVLFSLIAVSGCTAARRNAVQSTQQAQSGSFGKPKWSFLSSDGGSASGTPINTELFPPSGGTTFSDREFNATHPRVEEFVHIYQTRWRTFFQQAMDRSARYLPQMTAIMRHEGVPTELAYLPFVESGYRTEAVSSAGAVGQWQFIPATGRRYGLRIDRYVDERRDPVKSTRAAARYLKDLYDMFGSWHLSLAAYNTGEGNVARAIERNGGGTYWEMMENNELHPETCDFVPLFLAALHIARNPEEHGIYQPEEAQLRYDLVTIDRPVSLRTVAKMVGASAEEVTDLNPALVRGVTPPDREGYRVRVPEGTKEVFEFAYARMIQEAKQVEDVAQATQTNGTYRAQRGDTVATIARRFGVSVASLNQVNHWRNPSHLKAGTIVHLPGGPARSAPVRVASKSTHGRRMN